VRDALNADLRRYFRSVGSGNHPAATIVIGTATDPYQPAERRFPGDARHSRATRGIPGLSIGIITKARHYAGIYTSATQVAAVVPDSVSGGTALITVDAGLIRKVEARSPSPAVRLRALRRLRAAGINAGLIVAPILPGITDDRPHLEALFQAARDADAKFVHAGPLRLYAAVRDRFLPMLEAEFPHLVERYVRAYARYSSAPRDYATALRRRIQRLQARFGLPVNRGMQDRYQRRRPPPQVELAL
jgi:DNA repair photolyase